VRFGHAINRARTSITTSATLSPAYNATSLAQAVSTTAPQTQNGTALAQAVSSSSFSLTTHHEPATTTATQVGEDRLVVAPEPSTSGLAPVGFTSSHSKDSGAIGGGTVAALVLLALLLLLALCCRRRRRRPVRDDIVYSEELQEVSDEPIFIPPILSEKMVKGGKSDKKGKEKGEYEAMGTEDYDEVDDVEGGRSLYDPFLRDRPTSMNPAPISLGLVVHSDSGMRIAQASDVPASARPISTTVSATYVQVPPRYTAD